MCTSVLDLLSADKRTQLAGLVIQQEEPLEESKCIDPAIGRWVDEFDVPFLLEVLSTGDEEFKSEFAAVRLSEQERLNLLESIVIHIAECPYCQLKMEYDAELDKIIHGGSGQSFGYVSIGSHA
jgi:hypothetical protein